MRTKFFFFAMLVSVAASAQSTVQIMPISATYTSTPTIQFKVSWTNQSTANHRNKVWVFVDFQPVISPIQKGSWQPATITGTAQRTAGTISEQSNRGFFLEGTTTNFASTVTVTLSNVTGKFNWCAYATDYPPNIASVSNGTYTLKGTQSFVLNETTISGNKYAGSVTSLTDPTGSPGCIAIRDFQFSSANVNIPCCPNLMAVGGYCRDLIADEAVALTCGSINIEVKNDFSGRTDDQNIRHCPSGWRWPTYNEAKCTCQKSAELKWENTYWVDGHVYDVLCTEGPAPTRLIMHVYGISWPGDTRCVGGDCTVGFWRQHAGNLIAEYCVR